jgi:hypothetical protein
MEKPPNKGMEQTSGALAGMGRRRSLLIPSVRRSQLCP